MRQACGSAYLIGAGGVGGWLASLLAKAFRGTSLVIWDGDTVERKNLDRQFYAESDIGQFKASALAKRLQADNPRASVVPKDKYFDINLFDSGKAGRLQAVFVGADNHVARAAALAIGDRAMCPVVVAANEYVTAEAYYYNPQWVGTPLDPRLYFPDLLTDVTHDPLAPACTGEGEAAPQLALSNMQAAAYGAWLYRFHTEEAETVPDRSSWPVHVSNNFARVRIRTLGELEGKAA